MYAYLYWLKKRLHLLYAKHEDHLPTRIKNKISFKMNKDILHLRLAMESKRWDEMVDRIKTYLKDQCNFFFMEYWF
jgi:hypothetical protein